jgi:type II restriction enzyme
MTDSRKKTKKIAALITQTVLILKSFGVPVEKLSHRRAERMAMAFLAVADVKKIEDFSKAKDLNDKRSIKTRDIINYVNGAFGEDISSGSYDDIRRKDLRLLVLGSIVLNTKQNAARNDSTRGYALNPKFAFFLKSYGNPDWDKQVKKLIATTGSVKDVLTSERKIEQIPIIFPDGKKLTFSPGEHNLLQKAVIEDFLPRFGYGAEVLYVGDTADKFLFLDEEKIKRLNFFDIGHGELPDLLAYSAQKNWLYLIEAVHSSGPVSSIRMAELKKLTKNCTAELIFITAFLNKETFRKFTMDIAWESEVWIAENPDHMIHFNGDKFVGPYK